jgi:predicted nucleic acid-binding protein
MKKLKLYIETSAWNFFFADDAPEKMAITKEFFSQVAQGAYDVFSSEVVLAEINRAPADIREKLLALISQHNPVMVELTEEAERLAEIYIERKIIPEKKEEDALHIAIATVEELDAVITWNYKHLANIRKAELFFSVNLERGFHKKVEIITPWEVVGYVEN